jgi:hypothetical protein
VKAAENDKYIISDLTHNGSVCRAPLILPKFAIGCESVSVVALALGGSATNGSTPTTLYLLELPHWDII